MEWRKETKKNVALFIPAEQHVVTHVTASGYDSSVSNGPRFDTFPSLCLYGVLFVWGKQTINGVPEKEGRPHTLVTEQLSYNYACILTSSSFFPFCSYY